MSEIVNPTTQVRMYDKKVMLAAPWYRDVYPQTAFSFAQLRDRRRTHSCLNYGDAFVAHTRNRLADLFLQSDCDYMLTIDSDMVVPFGNAAWFNGHTGFNLPEPFASFNALDRLMSHGKTLVGALYFGRQKRHNNAMFNEAMGNDALSKQLRDGPPRDQLLATRWVGTGCLLIHRSVFEDIEKKFPVLARASGSGGHWFTTSEHTLLSDVRAARDAVAEGHMTGEKCLKVFSMLESALANARANSTLAMGEDVQFCIRAAQAGHQCYVDLGLRCGHIGDHVY